MTFFVFPNRHAVNTTNGSLLRIHLFNIIHSLGRKVVFRIFVEVAPPGSPNPDPAVQAKGRHFQRTQFRTKSLFSENYRIHFSPETLFELHNVQYLQFDFQ